MKGVMGLVLFFKEEWSKIAKLMCPKFIDSHQKYWVLYYIQKVFNVQLI